MKLLVLLGCLGLLHAAPRADAVPSQLNGGRPVITALLVGVQYDAAADHLQAVGTANDVVLAGWPPPIHRIVPVVPDSFMLMSTIDDAGTASAGTLAILGTTDLPGATSGTLLTGQLSGFAYPAGGPGLFEFVFRVDGGDLAPLLGPLVDLILDSQDQTLGSGFQGSFATDFNNNGNGNANTFAMVPEPLSAASVLLGLAALGMGCAVSRRSRQA